MVKTFLTDFWQLPTNKVSIFAVFLLWISSVYCSVPVITDLTIVTGKRGVVVSISADAPFNAQLIKCVGSSVYISLNDCKYGLNSFSYNHFTSDAAVRNISAREINNSKDVELVITLNSPADSMIKAHFKGKSWFALLSSKSFPEHKWSSSDFIQHQKKELSQISADKYLKCIRLYNREKICELFFDFNDAAESEIRRNNDTLIIKFFNAKSEVDSTFYNLPQGTVFKNIRLDENVSAQTRELKVLVALNREPSDTTFNIVCKKGRGLSIFSMIKNGQKAVLWNSDEGLKLGYDFYQMPLYEVDMKTLEKEVLEDTAVRISKDLLFAIKEQNGTNVSSDSISISKKQLSTDTVMMEESVQENIMTQDIMASVQPVTSDSLLAMKVSLGSEIPIPANEEMLNSEIGSDTGFIGSSKHLIRYNRNGRDPFLPYNGYMESGFGLPFIENLDLVGILYDEKDRIALLEDKKSQNRPFAMREDDKVEKGKVLKIYRDKVVFLITEYGISRSVILRLTNTSSNQEVGIR